MTLHTFFLFAEFARERRKVFAIADDISIILVFEHNLWDSSEAKANTVFPKQSAKESTFIRRDANGHSISKQPTIFESNSPSPSASNIWNELTIFWVIVANGSFPTMLDSQVLLPGLVFESARTESSKDQYSEDNMTPSSLNVL